METALMTMPSILGDDPKEFERKCSIRPGCEVLMRA